MSSVIGAICLISLVYLCTVALSHTRLEHNCILTLARYLLGVKTEAQLMAEEPIGHVALLEEWIANQLPSTPTDESPFKKIH